MVPLRMLGGWEDLVHIELLGAADGETTPTDTDGELRRLGLLAVACSDGKLRILRYSCVCVCMCVCVCVCAWSLLEKVQ